MAGGAGFWNGWMKAGSDDGHDHAHGLDCGRSDACAHGYGRGRDRGVRGGRRSLRHARRMAWAEWMMPAGDCQAFRYAGCGDGGPRLYGNNRLLKGPWDDG